MKDNPYIGPRPYEQKDLHNFYGRTREARDLLSLILANRVVVFYAESGAGKTSLLNAQIIPALGERGFNVLPVTRVGGDLPPGIDPASVQNVFVFSALTKLAGQNIPAQLLTRNTLLLFLRQWLGTMSESPQELDEDETLTVSGGRRPPILIVDQFEELFTRHRSRWQDARGFCEQLGDALRGLPDLGVVLALRDDYVAGLDPFAPLFPKRLRARYRMERLSVEGALEAVQKPALRAGVPFAPGVAERLVDDLRRISLIGSHELSAADHVSPVAKEGEQSDTSPVLGPDVEPVQLQVVCNRLWENLPEEMEGGIGWQEVQRYGNVDRALAEFYESAVAHVVNLPKASEPLRWVQRQGSPGWTATERQVRDWFGKQLITPLQTRGMALRGENDTAGLPNPAADTLEHRHIIRIDARGNTWWYELVHDRLIEPILQSNRDWEAARQTPLRLTAQRWQGAGRDAGILYRGETLKDALAWAAANPAEVEPYEHEFLEASQQAERARTRSRLLTIAGVVAVALVAIVMAFLAVTADRARRYAEQQRQIALSRQLAAQALTRLGDQLDLSLLFSLEANRLTGLTEAKSSLLAGLTQSPHLAAFLHGHTGTVALSPDGKTMASGDTQGVIRLWDLTTRQPVGLPLVGHTARVSSLAFSPDGKTLASASSDKSVILWDVSAALNTSVAAQQMLGAPLTVHTGDVRSVAFSPDGKLLASGSYDKSVILWDVATRQPIGSPITGHTAFVVSVAFSPDGQTLASGSCGKMTDTGSCTRGEIRLWDVATHQPLGPPLASQADWVLSVVFSPDGQTLASANQDKSILLWNVAARQPITPTLTGHTGLVANVSFSPDGKMMASAGADNSVILWDVALGTTQSRRPIGGPLTGHTTGVRSVAFGPDGRMLVSGSNNEIILWDTAIRQPLGETLEGHANWVLSMALAPDGRTLASGSCSGIPTNEQLCSPGEIRLWDMALGTTRTRRPLGQPLTLHTGWVNSLAFSPDGKLLASGSDDKTIILTDLASRQPVGTPLAGHTDWVLSVAFAPDGRTLASGGQDDNIFLWDVASHRPVGEPLTGHGGGVRSVVFSPDGKTLVSGGCAEVYQTWFCSQGEIRLWDVTARRPIGSPLVAHKNWITSLAFSPDGKLLASASDDNTIILWDVAARQPLGAPLTNHKSGVWSVTFSPVPPGGGTGGKVLASGSKDKTIILWDVATRQPFVPPLRGHTDTVRSVVFSPDGRTLVSGSRDHTLIVWDISTESWKSRACRIANRNLTRAEWGQFIGADIPYQRSCPDLPPGE